MRNLPRLFRSLGGIRDALSDIRDSLAAANQAIYEFMAPRLATFLSQQDTPALPSLTLKPNVEDSERFFAQALALYTEARCMSQRAAHRSVTTEETAELLAARQQLVHRGNLLATFGEQAYRAQPHFDKVAPFIARSTRFMRLTFPGASVPFGASSSCDRDWSRVYDRMGIDIGQAPLDPRQLCAERFAPLYPPTDPRYLGTIGHLLSLGIEDPRVAAALRMAPPSLEPAVQHQTL